MTTFLRLMAMASMCLVLPACSESESEAGPTDLGGDANIPMNTVGNVFSAGQLTVGQQAIDLDGSLTVLSNDDGLITARFSLNTESLLQTPAFAAMHELIAAEHKDAAGNIDTELQFKSTSEGIMDYANVDRQPHMLIRYDDDVGAEYTITKSTGRTLTRRIISKSSVDDFEYGFQYIKTTTVESVLNAGGVYKVVYRANHKFGIVHVEATLEDGSTISGYLYSAN